MLTRREQEVLQEIQEWREQTEAHQLQYAYTEWFEKTISLIPEDIQLACINKADQWLFFISSWLQDSEIQKAAKAQILTAARAFDEEIEHIGDLKRLTIDQLTYLFEQQLAKQRIYSLLQGAAAGTGSSLFIALDIPALVLLNLRAVQLTAISYGYEINSPFELMLSLKVFHSASLPKQWQNEGWDYLLNELEMHEQSFFYEGHEEVLNQAWLEKNSWQVIKVIILLFMKRQVSKRNPLAGMFAGGVVNYRFTRQVTDYAKRFYQYRYLQEKGRFDE